MTLSVATICASLALASLLLPPLQEAAAPKPAAAPSAESGSIAGTIKNRWLSRMEGAVYVEKIEGKTFDPPREAAIMDQKSQVFVPHLLVVVKGTKVDFPNSDSVRHNVFAAKGSATQFNFGTYEAGTTKTIALDNPGEISLLCNVHSEMSGFIIVTETPYFAVTDKKGEFTIPNVPPGKYRLTAWHEKLKKKTIDVAVEAGKTAKADFEGMESR